MLWGEHTHYLHHFRELEQNTMRVESESKTVGEYFNTSWQAGLIRFFGISVNTTVRILWVVDNPASSYQLQDITPQSAEQALPPHPITKAPININWNWFSPDDSDLSKIRLDYHKHEDILYIINQEQRHHSRTVYDVLKPRTTD